MNFERSWFLWFLVPVWGYLIFLYLFRRQPRLINFPTLRFFRESEPKTTSIIRRKTPPFLLQLLLDLLITASLIASLSLPYMQAYRVPHLVLVVDNSFSMEAKDIEPNRFSYLIQEAKEFVRKYPASKYSLVVGESPFPQLLEAKNRSDLIKKLEEIRPTATGFRWKEALSLAKSAGGEDALIHLLTDGTGLPALEKDSGYASYFSGVSLSGLPPLTRSDNVYFKRMVIEKFEGKHYLFLVVKNEGSSEITLKIVVSYREPLWQTDISLSAGEEREILYKLEDNYPYLKAEFKLLDGLDYLEKDNQVYFVAGRKNPLVVALVGRDNFFLKAALSSIEEDISVFELKLEDIVFGDYDLFFLLGSRPSTLPLKPVVLLNQTGSGLKEVPILPEEGEETEYIIKEHPLFKYVDLENLVVEKVYPGDYAGEVLLALRQGDKEIPLIIMEEVPAFRLTFAFPMSSSNLTLLPAFPTLIKNIISYSGLKNMEAYLGEEINLEEGEVVFPSGKKIYLSQGMLKFEETGIYEVKNVFGSYYVSVNFPPEESSIQATLSSLPLPETAKLKPLSLVPYLILFCLVLLAWKNYLLWRGY